MNLIQIELMTSFKPGAQCRVPARDEATPTSDIDLMIDFDELTHLTSSA